MKKVWLLVVLAGLFVTQGAFAQQAGFRYNSRTGDKELDLSLGNLNVEAQADMNNFINRLSVSYNVPAKSIDVLIHKEKMQPADVYMSVRVSRLANQPLDTVVREYKANRGRGWGVIAKNLGIRPGSREFHALKHDDSGMLGETPGKGHGRGNGNGRGHGRGHDRD